MRKRGKNGEARLRPERGRPVQEIIVLRIDEVREFNLDRILLREGHPAGGAERYRGRNAVLVIDPVVAGDAPVDIDRLVPVRRHDDIGADPADGYRLDRDVAVVEEIVGVARALIPFQVEPLLEERRAVYRDREGIAQLVRDPQIDLVLALLVARQRYGAVVGFVLRRRDVDAHAAAAGVEIARRGGERGLFVLHGEPLINAIILAVLAVLEIEIEAEKERTVSWRRKR